MGLYTVKRYKGKNILYISLIKEWRFEIMKVRLSLRDIELICYLGRYKQIKSTECKKVYKSVDYYRKRLKVLEKARYVKREKGYYIKIDIEGKRLLQDFGYENYSLCRNKDYKDRIKDIARIAMLGFEEGISFKPSWELKENNIYTNFGRKYIGKLEILQNEYIVYYISNRNKPGYIKQIITDIDKLSSNDKVIVFLENFDRITKRSKCFNMCDKSIQIINPTEENLELIKSIKNIGAYEIVKEIYKGKEIVLSNWRKADYMTEDENYIVIMPFIDTMKIQKLNIVYNENEDTNKHVDILTLCENKRKIVQLVDKSINIIEIDGCLEKVRNEKCYMNELLYN